MITREDLANKKIDKLENIEQAKEMINLLTYDECLAVLNGKDRVQSSTVGDKLCKDVVRYTMFEEQINKEIDEFFDAKNQIIREIRGLHDKRYIQVLTKIYVQFKSVKNAAQEMKLSYSYTIDLHKQALEAFENAYDNLHYLT